MSESMTITRVPGVNVGHFTDSAAQTGLTVLRFPGGAVAGVDVRGAAPGTRETDLLRPENSVQSIHALLLTGGSAFGLDAAAGVMDYLQEMGEGVAVGPLRVPIVPGAVIFDLGTGQPVAPTREQAYHAMQEANDQPVVMGRVGVGTGATVGKLRGMMDASPGGLGSACITLPDGTLVGGLAVVNAFGDVVGEGGQVLAGLRGPSTEEQLLAQGDAEPMIGGNTTLGVVATNARLDKAGCLRLAQMAHDGFARSIHPCHTPYDGDVIFVVSTGNRSSDLLSLGVAAVHVMEQSVRCAVQ